jgi:hypothetical protein
MFRALSLIYMSIISIPTHLHRQVLLLYFPRQFIDLRGNSRKWGLDKISGGGALEDTFPWRLVVGYFHFRDSRRDAGATVVAVPMASTIEGEHSRTLAEFK